MKSKKLHFKVCGEGITSLVRSIYLYEEKEKAWNIMGTLKGITIDQSRAVFQGDAKLVNNKEDDTTLNLVYEEDKEWKKEFSKHLDFLVKIEKEKINEEEEKEYVRLFMIDHIHLEYQEAVICIRQAMQNKLSTRSVLIRAKEILIKKTIAQDVVDRQYRKENKLVIEAEKSFDESLEEQQKKFNLKIATKMFINNISEKDKEKKKINNDIINTFAIKIYSFVFKDHQYIFNDSARNQTECPHCGCNAPDGSFWRVIDKGYIGYCDFGTKEVAVCFECPECFEKFYYHYKKNYVLRALEDNND